MTRRQRENCISGRTSTERWTYQWETSHWNAENNYSSQNRRSSEANFSKKSQVFTSFSESTFMRHLETRVAFVWRRHFRCWGGPWVTEFHWVGSASKRGLWVGTCIFGFSWVGTPVFSHFECRQARPEGFFGRPVGRRRTEQGLIQYSSRVFRINDISEYERLQR